MLSFTELQPFFRAVLRYVGNGYTQCQLSYIPDKKKHKLPNIDTKLKNIYKSNLSQGKRQYRRKKGLCNYAVLRYRDFFYLILKSPGKDELNEKWKTIYKLPLKLGNTLELQIIKDERNKNTIKISKQLLKEIKSKIALYIEKKQGNKLHTELNKLYNLHKALRYRGISIQISTILKEIKKLQKMHGTKYNVPKFF